MELGSSTMARRPGSMYLARRLPGRHPSVDDTSPRKACHNVIFHSTALFCADESSLPTMTSSNTPRQRLVASLTAIFIGTTSVAMPFAHAQDEGGAASGQVDYEPPLLEHEVVPRGTAGESQVFLATATDDQGLDEVTLFHRFRGDERYASLPMRALEESDNYTGTVNTLASEARNIEYYIEATDVSGNRVVQGFVFEPLVRVMEPAPMAIGESEEPAEEAPEGMSLTRKIVYVTLGVLAVGGIAAALDSSDSDSGSGGGGNNGSGDDGSADGSATGGDTGGNDDSTAGDGSDDSAAGDGNDDSTAGDDAPGGNDAAAEETDGDTGTDEVLVADEGTEGEPVGVQFGGTGVGFGVTF